MLWEAYAKTRFRQLSGDHKKFIFKWRGGIRIYVTVFLGGMYLLSDRKDLSGDFCIALSQKDAEQRIVNYIYNMENERNG